MNRYTIYTDGACSGNPGPGGLAALILSGTKEIVKISKGFKLTTNNRMEILAAAEGLNTLRDLLHNEGEDKKDTAVTIYSDSQLVVNTMNLGWSRNTNTDAWERLDQEVRTFKKVTFEKVKGHASNPFNDIVDRLAVGASKRGDNFIDIGYENATLLKEKENGESLFKEGKDITISEIRLRNMDKPDGRSILVILSNAEMIEINGYQGGFTQNGGTTENKRLTTDIAFRYLGWLNGGEL